MQMLLKPALAIAALLLVAACQIAPPDDAGAGAMAGGAGAAGNGAGNDALADGAGAVVEPVAAPDPRTPGERLVDTGDRVFFDFDRHNIRSDGRETLRRQAELLRAHPGMTVVIAGHCDERGTREYNLALGERRAAAAKNYLVQEGIDAARISTVSWGKERPIVLGHTKAAWAQNRVAITAFE